MPFFAEMCWSKSFLFVSGEMQIPPYAYINPCHTATHIKYNTLIYDI